MSGTEAKTPQDSVPSPGRSSLVGARGSLSVGRQLISYKGLHAHAHAFRALSLRVLTPRLTARNPQMVTGSSLQLYVSGVDRTRNSL